MNESELTLTAVRGCRRVDLYANPVPLSADEARHLEAIQERRKGGEPIQYILGECEFMGLTLKVDRRVLIPRPETEILVEEVLKAARAFPKRDLRILDIGTGSGNIAVSLAENLPQASIVAIDVSPEALGVAKANAALNGVLERIEFVHAGFEDFSSDQRSARIAGATSPIRLRRIGGLETSDRFDLIVSNPPYVPSGQIDYLSLNVRQEPRVALDGGVEGLKFYEPVISVAMRLLNNGGMMFLEIGDGQAARIAEILKRYSKFIFVDFIKDYSGVDRIVQARLSS